jgi:hypothetical protein
VFARIGGAVLIAWLSLLGANPTLARELQRPTETCRAYVIQAARAGLPLPDEGRQLIQLLARVLPEVEAVPPVIHYLAGNFGLRDLSRALGDMAAGRAPRPEF